MAPADLYASRRLPPIIDHNPSCRDAGVRDTHNDSETAAQCAFGTSAGVSREMGARLDAVRPAREPSCHGEVTVVIGFPRILTASYKSTHRFWWWI